MRIVVQRVKRASVSVDGELISSIQQGLMVLLGAGDDDNEKDAEFLMRKVCSMRIFSDEQGKMNLSVRDVGGGILLISQFTLYGEAKKGNRPSFIRAMEPVRAKELYEYAASLIEKEGIPVGMGVFGADMKIDMLCDGPVTILLDTDEK